MCWLKSNHPDSLHWSQTAAERAAAGWKWRWAGGRVESEKAPGWTPSSPCPSSSSPPSSLPACHPRPACPSTSSGLHKGRLLCSLWTNAWSNRGYVGSSRTFSTIKCQKVTQECYSTNTKAVWFESVVNMTISQIKSSQIKIQLNVLSGFQNQ